MEEVVQEMTLDEWKNLQEQNRPKPEFNIRKPETTVPSKAVVIHKSKYRDDVSINLDSRGFTDLKNLTLLRFIYKDFLNSLKYGIGTPNLFQQQLQVSVLPAM